MTPSRDYRAAANSPSGAIADSDTFTYDDASRMLTAVSGRYTNTAAYTYDAGGRKASESLTIGGQTYTTATMYNSAGQVVSYTYPNGDAVTRTYTDRAQLAGIAYNGTTVDTRTYDDGGRMTGSTYNNGVGETRAYNTDNTLASISYTGASIGNLTYGWDNNKNKTSETITGTMSGYGFTVPTSGYDDEDRLTAWNRADANLNQSWNLTAVGDWTSITENGVAQSRTHGPTHEMLTAAGQAVTHDTKGNTTSIPAILRPSSTAALSLTWDQDNRLSSATDGTVTVSYQFDALGRRVARTESAATTVYVQNGQQTFADYTLGAVATSPSYTYTYASYIDEPVLRTGTGDWRYYHRNQQYSVVALTDATANIKERYAYTAYGTPSVFDGAGVAITVSAENNRYTYTGREWDEELGLYHYRARMYDSGSGRFVGRDPIGFKGSQAHLNAYLSNSPLRAVDPTGLCKEECPGESETGSCGHDITGAFTQYLAIATPTLKNLPSDQTGSIDGLVWLYSEGQNIDFWVKSNPQDSCCATKECGRTVKLCGNCVRDTVSNNILFGFVAAAHGVTYGDAQLGANINNQQKGQGMEGCEQRAAYKMGFRLWAFVSSTRIIHQGCVGR